MKTLKTLNPKTFKCPKSVEVYLHTKRYLPKKTRDALMQLIECAVKFAKTVKKP